MKVARRWGAARPRRDARPTLLMVLRRAHLGVALVSVTIGGLALTLVGVLTISAYANNNLSLIARSMAYTAEAAVVFNNAASAAEALASIGAMEGVAKAVAIAGNGQVLATWQPVGQPFPRLSLQLARLLLDQPATALILHNGEQAGEIRIWGSGSELLWFVLAGIGGVVACQSLIVASALYLSRRMLDSIVGPLRSLVAVAHAVRRERAFGRRVPSAKIAELDELGNDFNALLDELESWQDRIQRENAMLAYRASHDGLTGLPNRTFFERRLRRAIADATVDESRVAVLYIDVDRFKDVNDSFGHNAGDAVLAGVAGRIKARMRESDLVARIGGDEFAVLIAPAHDESDLRRIADAIQADMQAPIQLPEHSEIIPSVSIGIGIFPDNARHAEALLHSADLEMYLAKRRRRAAGAPAREP